jgi:hypothetical protein
MTPEREVINSWIAALQALRTWTPGTRRAVGHLMAQMETGRRALETVLERSEGRE